MGVPHSYTRARRSLWKGGNTAYTDGEGGAGQRGRGRKEGERERRREGTITALARANTEKHTEEEEEEEKARATRRGPSPHSRAAAKGPFTDGSWTGREEKGSRGLWLARADAKRRRRRGKANEGRWSCRPQRWRGLKRGGVESQPALASEWRGETRCIKKWSLSFAARSEKNSIVLEVRRFRVVAPNTNEARRGLREPLLALTRD